MCHVSIIRIRFTVVQLLMYYASSVTALLSKLPTTEQCTNLCVLVHFMSKIHKNYELPKKGQPQNKGYWP